MTDWVEPLRELFIKEIDAYQKLLGLELQKKEAIKEADGKLLQSLVKESYHIMVEASELERVRMKTIEEIYRLQDFEKGEQGITLSNFLNQMDRESNFQLKGSTHQLKSIVQSLKEAILTNEKLLNNRKDFLNHTLETMKENSKERVYEKPNPKKKKGQGSQGSLMLNATA